MKENYDYMLDEPDEEEIEASQENKKNRKIEAAMEKYLYGDDEEKHDNKRI